MAYSSDQMRTDNRLLAAMPTDVISLLRKELRQVSVAQGSIMLEAGAPIESIYFPQTGLASLLIVSKDGRPFEAATVGREGAVGLHSALGRRRSFTRATAQIGGKFSTIRAARFNHVVESNAAVRDLVTRYLEMLWAEAQQIAVCNAAHDASARLCRWLLQSADRIGSERLALTQEFLAQMLGVRRTTVNLLARSLQAKGSITYRRGEVVIVDRKALEACACECYHAIHHDNLPRALGFSLWGARPLLRARAMRRRQMPRYYFHLCDTETIKDREGTDLAGLAEARSHAAVVARELTQHSTGMLDRGWSEWTMSVEDANGQELFSLALADPAAPTND